MNKTTILNITNTTTIKNYGITYTIIKDYFLVKNNIVYEYDIFYNTFKNYPTLLILIYLLMFFILILIFAYFNLDLKKQYLIYSGYSMENKTYNIRLPENLDETTLIDVRRLITDIERNEIIIIPKIKKVEIYLYMSIYILIESIKLFIKYFVQLLCLTFYIKGLIISLLISYILLMISQTMFSYYDYSKEVKTEL